MAAAMLDMGAQKLIDARQAGKISSPKSKVTVQLRRGDVPVETMNVMGFLEGTDKKEEVIVISAHFDHVGKDAKGNIYNGADDDGSGTCAVLELAEAFVKAKEAGNGPRRSILFLWVTGEEKGLLGSKYFTDVAPTVPLENIVCNLNIDMIGRVDKEHEENEKYVYLIGSDKLSSELHTLSEAANKQSVNYALDYTFNDPKDPNRFYYRSDHYNFAKKGIPVIFYFTGVHADYHQPGDDVEKIMFPKYQDIVRLVFHTGWEVSNRDKRIVVDSNKP
jgi:Zn-dependent M28 family amino/carboxypeptidase